MRKAFAVWAVASIIVGLPGRSAAVGEAVNGFPNWAERVMHEWTNRARSDPQFEMTACGAHCALDASCYTPAPPLAYTLPLNRAARFHADEMRLQGFFSHTSACTVVANIDSLYPASCDGSASCACSGGVNSCSPTCTEFFTRDALFSVSAPSGEVEIGLSDPDAGFYLALREQSTDPTCGFTFDKGERWLLLKSTGALGAGLPATYAVVEFGAGTTPTGVVSGSHYPRQASDVDVWANWFGASGPHAAVVNVDGVCHPMALSRGSATNGAWKATLTNVASGCHRYYFEFRDATDALVSYPTSGSLGIGPPVSCADWDAIRAPSCGLPTLDIDGSTNGTQYDALTDGLLAIRYLFELTGTSLTNGAIGPTATLTDPPAIKTHLDAIRPLLDIDGDGNVDALTDGLLMMRYLFGLRGASLIQNALAPGAQRTTAPAIEAYLGSLLP